MQTEIGQIDGGIDVNAKDVAVGYAAGIGTGAAVGALTGGPGGMLVGAVVGGSRVAITGGVAIIAGAASRASSAPGIDGWTGAGASRYKRRLKPNAVK